LSILVLDSILRELDIYLTEFEKDELYSELSRAFGFIGSYRECERLEDMWADPNLQRSHQEVHQGLAELQKKKEHNRSIPLKLQL